MEERLNKRWFWIAVVLISAISMLDYQFVAGTSHGPKLPGTLRAVIQMTTLVLVLMTGWVVWKRAGMFRYVWLYSYAAVLVVLSVTGVCYYWLHIVPLKTLSTIGFVRPFFCSPMPMLMLYMLRSFDNSK